MTVTAYPLAWPAAWPRTAPAARTRARFGKGYRNGALQSTAESHLLEELRRLGARDVVISTNVELRRDGLPYANRRQPDDQGVAVYFTRRVNGRAVQQCIPCDRWDRIADNMYAIALSIDAMRGLERWGAKSMVDAAFSGFKALPERAGGTPWWEVLGVASTATADEIRAAYRLRAKESHPDAGGSAEAFVAVQEAFKQGLAARS